jgi:glycosyltransferase involved in cell wall biosynthesis
MEADRRRVLVLAYFFPPVGGAGVQRTLKFVKYLTQFGWEATVVSTRSRAYGARDESLLADVPSSTTVIRTAALPLARYLGYALHRTGLKSLRAIVLWPDGGLGWMPFALFAALRAIRRERPDVLFSTSSPYGSHLVALLVAQLTGVPWVADFRDEWTANPHLADQPRVLSQLSDRAERAITRRAKAIVVAADYFELRGLARNDPRREEIVNGVDEEDFSETSLADPPSDRFVLSHVGTLYELQDPSAALRALAGLAESGTLDPGRAEVRLVGNVWIPGFAPPPGVRVEQTGHVEHPRAIAEMRAATVLLLYVPATSLAPSGKLFEYLASGRPVLCLARDDNLASRLVREWDAGIVADPHDEAAIASALQTLWARWQQDGLPDQAEVRRRAFEQYSRRATASQLASVLVGTSNA